MRRVLEGRHGKRKGDVSAQANGERGDVNRAIVAVGNDDDVGREHALVAVQNGSERS